MSFLYSGSGRQQCKQALSDRKKRQRFMNATWSADSFATSDTHETRLANPIKLFTLPINTANCTTATTSTNSTMANKGQTTTALASEHQLGEYRADEQKAFNQNPHFARKCQQLIHDYVIDAVVETGTYQGATTAWFSHAVPEVHSIEIEEEFYQVARQNLGEHYDNCVLHFGNSPDVLKQLLPQMKDKRILFYLDAHWNNYWPIKAELQAIAQSHARGQCVIVIDDFQIPGRSDIPFDSYQKQPLNLTFILTDLKQALPDLHFEYYIPPQKLLHTRGRLIALPKAWYWNSHQSLPRVTQTTQPIRSHIDNASQLTTIQPVVKSVTPTAAKPSEDTPLANDIEAPPPVKHHNNTTKLQKLSDFDQDFI
jgi:predicted O-methyltransferase YrrM